MEPNETHTLLRWDAPTKEQMRTLAAANRRSLNAELRHAVDVHLAREAAFESGFNRLADRTADPEGEVRG